MDETSFLLPPRSSPNPSTPPDRVYADDSGPGPSRVLEAAAPPRPRGLREIANLVRDSVPGSYILLLTLSPSLSSSPSILRSTLTPSSFGSQSISSHLLLHPPKLDPSRFHLRRRAARFEPTLRRCLLTHVGICYRLVLAPFASLLKYPTCQFLLRITGWTVALGGSTALDTLGSQAFTGGKNPTDLSIHLQRCVLMLWLLFIPVAIMWANMAPILIALGQEEELSRNTQQYLRVLLLAAPGYIGFECLKKYLQCQGMTRDKFIMRSLHAIDPTHCVAGIMDASTYVLVLITPINIALNVYFVHHTDLGLYGSPIALAFTFTFAFFFLIIYTAYSPTHTLNKTWGGLRLRAALDARSCFTFLQLALPGILMFGSEWYVSGLLIRCCRHSRRPTPYFMPTRAMLVLMSLTCPL
jgi:hypothetical protein